MWHLPRRRARFMWFRPHAVTLHRPRALRVVHRHTIVVVVAADHSCKQLKAQQGRLEKAFPVFLCGK